MYLDMLFIILIQFFCEKNKKFSFLSYVFSFTRIFASEIVELTYTRWIITYYNQLDAIKNKINRASCIVDNLSDSNNAGLCFFLGLVDNTSRKNNYPRQRRFVKSTSAMCRYQVRVEWKNKRNNGGG